jgi:hypothetical protein
VSECIRAVRVRRGVREPAQSTMSSKLNLQTKKKKLTATIHHHTCAPLARPCARLHDDGGGGGDVFGGIVGPVGTAAEDNVYIAVAASFHD